MIKVDAMDMRDSRSDSSINSVLNALRVLEEVAARQPVGVSELSRATGLPKSSAQRLVLTLHRAGWLRPVGSELTRWVLAPRILSVGLSALGEYGGLREAALPIMEWLRDETGETIHLAIREGGENVIIERIDSTEAVRTFVRLGTRVPLHATSTGRSILAYLPQDEVDPILGKKLTRYTKNTLVDPERVREELRAIRERGYAVNVCEWRPDVAAVGGAILTAGGRPAGAVTISMPMSRFRKDLVPKYGRLVVEATHRIAKSL
jgi:IclR family acetate operon transcriptional repressor